MVLLIRDHTDQQDIVLKCVEAVRRREDRTIDPQDLESPTASPLAFLTFTYPGLTNRWQGLGETDRCRLRKS